jgi:hypothetical protein
MIHDFMGHIRALGAGEFAAAQRLKAYLQMA